MKLLNQDPDEGEYVGNVFGPKVTLYAGIFLLLLTLLAVGRHYYLDVPFGFDDPLAPTNVDTTQQLNSEATKDSL